MTDMTSLLTALNDIPVWFVVFGFWDAVIGGAAALFGADLLGESNEEAADIMAGATGEANRITEKYLGLARGRMDELMRMGAPGMAYLRSVLASDEERLTPAQEEVLGRTRESTLASLDRSGLRGSGRATTAALRDVEGGVQNRMVEANRQRKDIAAGNLASSYGAGATGGANVNMGAAQALAGQAMGAGTTAANQATASGQIQADMIGTLGRIFADSYANRPSAYKAPGSHGGVDLQGGGSSNDWNTIQV